MGSSTVTLWARDNDVSTGYDGRVEISASSGDPDHLDSVSRITMTPSSIELQADSVTVNGKEI